LRENSLIRWRRRSIRYKRPHHFINLTNYIP